MIAVRRIAPALLVVMMALALPAVGQEPQPPRGERIIEAIFIWRLVDELDLTEGQIIRVLPRLKALKTIRIEVGRRVPVLRREIRQLSGQQPRDEEAIRVRVAELNLLRVEMESGRRRQLQMIAAALTPEQQAKFALIQETFEMDTLRLLEEMRRIVGEQSPFRR